MTREEHIERNIKTLSLKSNEKLSQCIFNRVNSVNKYLVLVNNGLPVYFNNHYMSLAYGSIEHETWARIALIKKRYCE